MCGRFSLAASIEALKEYFSLTKGFVMRSRYNIAPLEQIPVLKALGEADFLTWGWKPSWKSAENVKHIINARSENILEKFTFRQAFKSRRCLVMCDGFYEWKPVGRTKQPYYIRRPGNTPFAMAGIFEGDSVIILTRAANQAIETIHGRMPVIVDKVDFKEWLNPKADIVQKISPLLHTAGTALWEIYPVSPKVNHTQFDHPECILALN